MKTIGKLILELVAVIVLIVIVVFVMNHRTRQVADSKPIQEQPAVSAPERQEFCFSKNVNKDITDVTLMIEGSNVTGTMNWIPFEKDSARGTLSGTLDNGEMHLIYDYMIEGAHQTEEKIMKIENGKLLIKHGELLDPKYDGHLVYKDASTATYTEILDPCAK
jgi:hypothetical protein